MTEFYKNYVFFCAKKKKSLSRVAEEIGLSRTAPNGWKKGKIPSEVTLEKLSQYFDVPVSVLTSTEIGKAPTPVSESGQNINIVKITRRNGICTEKRFTDEQIQAIQAIIDQMPEAPEDL